MSIIARGLTSIASTFFGTSTNGRLMSTIGRLCVNNTTNGSLVSSIGKLWVNNTIRGFEQVRAMGSSLYQMHRKGPHRKKRTKKSPLDGKPFAKGVVLKTLIKKPKKPNSANRKCVLVRLSTGKEMVAYVPGIGHNLQEHNIVLCRVGKLQDTPGVKIKCVRGKYDLQHVVKPVPNK